MQLSLISTLVKLFLVSSVLSEPFDTNYCYFGRENLTNFQTGVPFKLPFMISFIEVATVSQKHFLEDIERPDAFKITLSLVSQSDPNIRRMMYSENVLAIDGIYDSGAEYIIPSTIPAGEYRFVVDFKYLDRIMFYKNSNNQSPVFTLKSGTDKFDQLFTKYGDNSGLLNRKQISIFYKTVKGLDGPERRLMGQVFKGSKLDSTIDRVE